MSLPESAFTPINAPSLADSVVVAMRRAIVNGSIPPGERLPETDLAARFRVSRGTVRQALGQLRGEGLVEIRPRRGAIVTRMRMDDARDVCTVRGLLEGWAARSACQRLGRDELAVMRRQARQMGESVARGDVYHVMELDINLHSLICRCDHNVYLCERWHSLNALHGALLASRLAYYNHDPVGIVHRHLALIDALATGDPDCAEAAVRAHYIVPFTDGSLSHPALEAIVGQNPQRREDRERHARNADLPHAAPGRVHPL